jgi:uncharacterized LabA/DUF88 family protein
MPTAILIDGSFFLRRYRAVVSDPAAFTPEQVARNLFTWAIRHLEADERDRRELYRIFFYDCPPLEKKAHNPITGRAIDFAKTPEAQFRRQLHAELRKTRKLALRLGRLAEHSAWVFRPEVTGKLLTRKVEVAALAEDDVVYDIRQKGVDMRIGLDIASLAFKHQVDQIVLFAGDADFVPAAKLARREGIDFVLDPMWQPIPADLHEHIDGLRSTCPKPMPREGRNMPRGGQLKSDFHEAMLNIYRRAKSECRYDAKVFLGMVVEHGGLEAAKRLLHAPDVQEGFTRLWECGRLDLTMEALIIQDPWNQLFTAEELAIAKRRLTQHGWRA